MYLTHYIKSFLMIFLSVILRRMSDFEKPLVLRLLWGGADIKHKFSLQENETGDIVVSAAKFSN